MDHEKTATRLLLLFEVLVAAIAALNGLPQLMENFRSDPDIMWAGVICLVGLAWLLSVYFGFSGHAAGWGRWLSVFITFIVLGLLARSQITGVIPPTKIVVLVANFEGAEPDKHQVTNELTSELRRTLKSYPNVEVRELGRAITEADGSAKARTVGKTEKASIVLWGWYRTAATPSELRLRIEVLPGSGYHRDPDKAVAFRSAITIEEWETAAINSTFPQDIGFLYPLVDGLTQYFDGNWRLARDRLSEAWDAAEKSKTSDQLQQVGDLIVFYQGLACEQIGWPDCTKDTCQRLLRSNLTPQMRGFVYNNLGNAAAETQNLSAALEAYTNAIQDDAKQGTAYANRALILYRLGDAAAAQADFDMAVELGTHNNTVMYVNLGNYYASASDWKQAEKQYNYAIRYSRYGSTQFLKALPVWIYHTFAGIKRDNLEALYYRGITYREWGRTEEARQDLTSARDLTTDGTVKKKIQKELDALPSAAP